VSQAEEVVGMRKLLLWGAVVVIALVAVAGGAALASGGGGHEFTAFLNGYSNAPSISTVAHGEFRAEIRGEVIRYRLTYQDLETPALFAHIHFAEPGVNGGIVAFLCGGGDKPACPETSGTVTGTIDPADILALDDQGIEAGSFAEAVRAIRGGATYANVHSERFPSGEIRGQLQESDHH
jgi:CHRD domain-containing protein